MSPTSRKIISFVFLSIRSIKRLIAMVVNIFLIFIFDLVRKIMQNPDPGPT